jgi:hypothetical protein
VGIDKSVSISFAILILSGLIGCKAETENNVAQVQLLTGPASETSSIEAGIVFLGSETYQCYPLSQVGISNPESISAIETSCECLAARVVEYIDGSGEFTHGLHIIFSDTESEIQSKGYLLKARVTIHFTDQPSKEVEVRFLHTSSPIAADAP